MNLVTDREPFSGYSFTAYFLTYKVSSGFFNEGRYSNVLNETLMKNEKKKIGCG